MKRKRVETLPIQDHKKTLKIDDRTTANFISALLHGEFRYSRYDDFDPRKFINSIVNVSNERDFFKIEQLNGKTFRAYKFDETCEKTLTSFYNSLPKDVDLKTPTVFKIKNFRIYVFPEY